MALLFLPKLRNPYEAVRAYIKSLEDPGYKKGRSGGAYVAGDLVENKKCILLCASCKHGFDWKKHHYYSYAHYDQIKGIGKCDRCKAETNQLFIYMHESSLGQAGITRQDTLRHRQQHAKIVG